MPTGQKQQLLDERTVENKGKLIQTDNKILSVKREALLSVLLEF